MEGQTQQVETYTKEEWEKCIECDFIKSYHTGNQYNPIACITFKPSGQYLLTEEEWNETE